MVRNTLLFSVSIMVVLAMSMPAAAQWVETLKFDADVPVSGDRYGVGVDFDGAIGIAGAENDGGAGKAFLFDVATGAQLGELVNPAPDNNDYFGHAVAISGNTAVVGAGRRGNWVGGAWVYDVSDPMNPSAGVPLPFEDDDKTSSYGANVAIDGDKVLVSQRNGGARIYDTAGTQIGHLFAENEPGVDFGGNVSIAGNIAAVSDGDGGAGNRGTVHLFDITDPGDPVAGGVMFGNGNGNGFGFSNSMSENGQLFLSSDIHQNNSTGVARIFDISDISTPMEVATLNPPIGARDGSDYTNFGYSLDMSNDNALIGRRDNYAFLYDAAGNLLQTLEASDQGTFGDGNSFAAGENSLSIHDNTAFIGSMFSNALDGLGDPVDGAGAVYKLVPEPSSFILLAMGAVGLLGFAWRRRRR